MPAKKEIVDGFAKLVKDYGWRSVELENLIMNLETKGKKAGSKEIIEKISKLEAELKALADYFLKFEKSIVVKDLRVHESFFKDVSYEKFIEGLREYAKVVFEILESTKKAISTALHRRKLVLQKLKELHKENRHWLRIFRLITVKIKEMEELYDENGIRYMDDPHYPEKFRYFYSHDCREELIHYMGMVESTYCFLSKIFGEIKDKTYVYFLNEKDWTRPEMHIKVPYGIGRCEYYKWFKENPFVKKIGKSRILFPKDFTIEKNPVGKQMLAILPILVCHEVTHLFLFENDIWLPDNTKSEIICNLVAFRIGQARMRPVVEIVKESVQISKKIFPGKDWNYFEKVFRDKPPQNAAEYKEFASRYIFLQIMLWQGIVSYFEKNGFGDLMKDTEGILGEVKKIKW